MRIIPEFDQPAHVAAGWDFKESEDLTVCKDKQPWYDYCNEPPCGQVRHEKIVWGGPAGFCIGKAITCIRYAV